MPGSPTFASGPLMLKCRPRFHPVSRSPALASPNLHRFAREHADDSQRVEPLAARHSIGNEVRLYA